MKRLLPLLLILASGPALAQPVLETWTFNESGNSLESSVIANKPTGVTSGDGLAIIVMNDSPNAGPEFSDSLTGWTFQGTGGNTATDVHLALYTRVADGTEGASETITAATARFYGAYYLRISGIDGTDFPHVVGSFGLEESNTTTHTAPSLNTTVDNTLVFYAMVGDGEDVLPVSVSGTGWSEVNEDNGGDGLGGATGLGATFGSRTLASAGASGDATVTSTASDSAVLLQFSVAPSSASGVYDTAPTVTAQSTTAYTVTGSLDAAGDADAVLCHKDETAPTIAQVQAGNCTGDVTARASDSASPSTGDFDFSLTLTPATALPVGDIYVTDGTTLTTLADEYLDAPANCGENSDLQCQFVDITSIGTGSVCEDFNTSFDPDIASPDVLTAPTTVEPGGGVDESLTIGADCQFSYDGDNTGQQKAFNITIHDVSAKGFHSEDIDFLDGNTAPSCEVVGGQAGVLDINVAMLTVDLDTYCSDVDSEQLTYTLEDTGTHTGSDNAATLTDSTQNFPTDDLIGLTISNDTDGSSCTITDNDATTVTCTLSGGSENDWDTGDAYTITFVLPTGLSLNGSTGTITGTPTVEDEDGLFARFTATDIGEETDTVDIEFYIIDTWTVPNGVNGTVSAWSVAIEAAAEWLAGEVSITTTFSCHETVAADDIISHTPTAGEEDDPFPSFSAVVSQGETTPGCLAVGKGRPKLGVKGARIGM